MAKRHSPCRSSYPSTAATAEPTDGRRRGRGRGIEDPNRCRGGLMWSLAGLNDWGFFVVGAVPLLSRRRGHPGAVQSTVHAVRARISTIYSIARPSASDARCVAFGALLMRHAWTMDESGHALLMRHGPDRGCGTGTSGAVVLPRAANRAMHACSWSWQCTASLIPSLMIDRRSYWQSLVGSLI